VMHAMDKNTDEQKPFHLRGARIMSSYENNFIKAKRLYDIHGKGHLKARVATVNFDGSAPPVPVSQLEWAHTESTTETAPPHHCISD